MKAVVSISGKRKATRAEVESSNDLPPKVVVFETEGGIDEESAALLGGTGKDSGGKLCPSSEYLEKTLTDWGLSQLEMMARAKADEVGPGFDVRSSDGMVRVPFVDSSGVPPEVDAVGT